MTMRRLNIEDQDVEPIIVVDPATYVCQDDQSSCPYTCTTLAACEACECAVADSVTGPWGKAVDVIFCLLPIIFLVGATLPPRGLKPLPTTKSLPISAFLMFIVRLMYLGSDPLLVCGSVIKGVHEAITPLSIMAGAICLFETMEVTRCMPYMMREMKALTGGHPVAELCVIFCFAYMVEGASGFGTPVALGAPMLISLGHPKLESVVVLLLFNTFATVFGAAGTPIWFGFGSLGLSKNDLIQIGVYAAVGLLVSAYLLVPFVFSVIVPFKMVKENGVFFVLALSGCMLPMLGISFVSYEFPSLIGGMIGLGVSAILVNYKVGMKPIALSEFGRHPMDISSVSEKSIVSSSSPFMSEARTNTGTEVDSVDGEVVIHDSVVNSDYDNVTNSNGRIDEPLLPKDDEEEGIEQLAAKDSSVNTTSRSGVSDMTKSLRAVEDAIGPRKSGSAYLKEFLLRTSPITLTVFLLIITRIPGIGLNTLLKKTEPSFSIYFGTYGTFKLSTSLVFQLENILTYPNLTWKYELLYTPFLVPFVLVSVITYGIYRKEASDSMIGVFGTVFQRVKNPAVALAGALTLVQLMTTGGESAPASIIGVVLSEALKGGWIAIAASIGALGSFFSGSTTVSNLTFGSVQEIAAEQIGVNANAMLALQVVGASAGNGICLNNIISACTVTGLVIGEGKVIARTAKIVFTFIVVGTLVMLPFLF